MNHLEVSVSKDLINANIFISSVYHAFIKTTESRRHVINTSKAAVATFSTARDNKTQCIPAHATNCLLLQFSINLSVESAMFLRKCASISDSHFHDIKSCYYGVVKTGQVQALSTWKMSPITWWSLVRKRSMALTRSLWMAWVPTFGSHILTYRHIFEWI